MKSFVEDRMKKLLYMALLAVAVLLFSSCSMNDTTSINPNSGFVHIQGNTSGVDVYVNGVAQTVKFDKTTHTALLPLSPGNYQIMIQRNGIGVVDEKVVVTSSTTTEVIVP
jgi:hypothetical protein